MQCTITTISPALEVSPLVNVRGDEMYRIDRNIETLKPSDKIINTINPNAMIKHA